MSRWRSHDEGGQSHSAMPTRIEVPLFEKPELSRLGNEDDQTRQTEARPIDVPVPESRKPHQDRGRTYMLRASEIQVMTEVGKFRALSAKDIKEFLYQGVQSRMESDLANLRKQHLILEREIPQHEGLPRRLVALTKEGRHLLVSGKSAQEGQALYHGFTKLREADHDADLYRLYQRGLEKANRDGARNIRVILDSELKRILYRDLARADEQGSAEARSAVAEKHGLRVVRGTIPVPDLRIEYETASGESARLDLELATEHYRFRNIARKVLAGFCIYARSQEAHNLRRVLDQREITAEILNL
jgi:hypothetical protein